MNQEDKQRNYELAEKLLAEQNFAAALKMGALTVFLAAAIYGFTIAKWYVAYGFMAVAIGIAVGVTMQYYGKGIETKFAVAAAVYTIVGWLLGHAFGLVLHLARPNVSALHDVFPSDALATLSSQLVAGRSFMDLVYGCVAIWVAVFLVKRPLSRAEKLALGTYEFRGKESN